MSQSQTNEDRLMKALEQIRDGLPALQELEKSAETNPSDRRRFDAIRNFCFSFAKSRNIPLAPGASAAEIVNAIAPSTLKLQTLDGGFFVKR